MPDSQHPRVFSPHTALFLAQSTQSTAFIAFLLEFRPANSQYSPESLQYYRQSPKGKPIQTSTFFHPNTSSVNFMTLNALKTLISSLFLASRTCRRIHSRHSASERLESRALLAGNVLVQLQNGNALITGDDAANQFEITGGLNSIRIRGLEGTTINGGAAEFTLASAATFAGNLRIQLGDGNDRLAIGADVTLAAAQIYGGNGDDNLSISTCTLTGNLVVDAELGNNTVTLLNAQIHCRPPLRNLDARR